MHWDWNIDIRYVDGQRSFVRVDGDLRTALECILDAARLTPIKSATIKAGDKR